MAENTNQQSTNRPGLVKLVKGSPQWKALGAMEYMEIRTFSYCLAGYCPPPIMDTEADAEVFPVYKALMHSIKYYNSNDMFEKTGHCHLGGVEGWFANIKWITFHFPMLAYFKYCTERQIEYPFNSERFTKEKAETSAKPPVEKTTAKQITLDKFEDLPICNGVKYSDLRKLLDESSPNYLPRLPILLQTATKLIPKTPGTTHYEKIRNNVKQELADAKIGSKFGKLSSPQYGVEKDKLAIWRILERDHILLGGRESNKKSKQE